MTTKCTGLMGHIFGHKWKQYCEIEGVDIFKIPLSVKASDILDAEGVEERYRKNYNFYVKCHRCGAVTGEKK